MPAFAQVAPQRLRTPSPTPPPRHEGGTRNPGGQKEEPEDFLESAEEDSVATNPNAGKRRRPVLATATEAKAYFGGDNKLAVDNVAFSFSKSGATLFAEFLSDYVDFGNPIGFARIGFGALINSGKSTENTLTQFMSGGGNGMMYLYLPVVSQSFPKARTEKARASLIFLPRIGMDIPTLNASIANPGYNADLGFEGQGLAASYNRVFQFFALVRLSAVFGSNDFYTNMGLPEGQKAFPMGRWTFGVDLNGALRISVTKPFIEPDRPTGKTPVMLSVQLVNREQP